MAISLITSSAQNKMSTPLYTVANSLRSANAGSVDEHIRNTVIKCDKFYEDIEKSGGTEDNNCPM